MERLHVFVDEFGDPHLDISKPGVSATYIVAALCVRDRALQKVQADAESIRKRLFQSGEMKSSLIGDRDGRRLHVLRELGKLDTFVVAFCARKSEIDTDTGLAFKKSFIKFFASSLYDRITRCGDDLQIIMDEHGNEHFQAELKSYLEKKHGHDLFSSARFQFDDSRRSVLLQMADVYAGSLARIHDEKKVSDRVNELSSELRNKVSITLWPQGREESVLPVEECCDEDDERIRRYCVKRAEAYLERAGRTQDDRDEMARVIFLDALLAHHTIGSEGDFLSTSLLKREISARIGEPISDHKFRSAVVAKLRDADVVISSCSKGYRLPSTAKDVRDFAAFSNSLVPPMVQRLDRARKGIREATLGRVDILGSAELNQLRDIVESLQR